MRTSHKCSLGCGKGKLAVTILHKSIGIYLKSMPKSLVYLIRQSEEPKAEPDEKVANAKDRAREGGNA